MPFIKVEPSGHLCRTPGRDVGFGTTWYCHQCLLVYRWDECEGHEENNKMIFHDGHWNLTGEVYESLHQLVVRSASDLALARERDTSIYHLTKEGADTLAEMLD